MYYSYGSSSRYAFSFTVPDNPSRKSSSLPNCLSSLTLSLIFEVSIIDRHKMFPELFYLIQLMYVLIMFSTHAVCLLYTRPLAQGSCIVDPSFSRHISIIPSILSDDPISLHPRSYSGINNTELFPEEIWPFHLLHQLPLGVIQCFSTIVLLFLSLELSETLDSRQNTLVEMIDPNSCHSPVHWIGGKKTWRMRWIRIIQEFKQNQRLVESFSSVLNCGNQSLRIEL